MSEPYLAVIADMDGVLTRTAGQHERAWKRTFDEFLPEHEPEFSHQDYRRCVDGKPRYRGVADFLASRAIELPWGSPSDDPDRRTVCGVGNRKNRSFLELLDTEGVEVFEDAVAALKRWRRGGLKIAAISASRNARRVLEAAGLVELLDEVVDGKTAEELDLAGKPEILIEAARRLDVEPARAVVLEDATAGVEAGRRSEFGRVVGIARDEAEEAGLRQAGADAVVTNVFEVRFERVLPDAVEYFDQLEHWRDQRPLAVFLDFDGTLAPIVDQPGDAAMSEAMKSAVRELSRRAPVAIISGRDRPDVEARADLDDLVYAGSHGFDIGGRGHDETLSQAEAVLDDVDRAERELEQRHGSTQGVILERKRFSIAVHYRQVEDPCVVEQIGITVERLAEQTKLRKRTGKKVFELEPDIDWDKGKALLWLLDNMPSVQPGERFLIYIGDDVTDEDAFAALRGRGAGVRVGEEISDSLADYRVSTPEDVRVLLSRLVRQT